MTISREINGQMMEIELTKGELFSAYREQERAFDLASCDDYLDDTYRDEEWYSTLDEEKRNELLENAADELRRNIDKYDMDFEYAMSDAFCTAIARCLK